jgi:hypothetical protein
MTTAPNNALHLTAAPLDGEMVQVIWLRLRSRPA